jgi:hypothetical protein
MVIVVIVFSMTRHRRRRIGMLSTIRVKTIGTASFKDDGRKTWWQFLKPSIFFAWVILAMLY